MTMVTVTVPDAAGMHRLGRQLAEVLGRGDVLVLTGPLGAGKTTLTRGLGDGLGVRGTVASPTFIIARTHPSLTDGPMLVHVDAYRLQSALELDDLDLDLDASVTVIEWGAEVVSALTNAWLEVEIARPVGAESGAAIDRDAYAPLDEPRRVTLRAVGERWTALDLAPIVAGFGV